MSQNSSLHEIIEFPHKVAHRNQSDIVNSPKNDGVLPEMHKTIVRERLSGMGIKEKEARILMFVPLFL